MGVYNKIRDGFYASKMEYPTKPQRPVLLDKKAADLTPEDLTNLATVKAEYEMALAEFPKQHDAYHAEEARHIEQFWLDAFAENGIDPYHPLAPWVRGQAWDKGHAYGLSEVYSHFQDLVRLFEIVDQHFVRKT